MEIKRIELMYQGDKGKPNDIKAWTVYYEDEGKEDYVHVFAVCELTALVKAPEAIQQSKEIKALQKIAGRIK